MNKRNAFLLFVGILFGVLLAFISTVMLDLTVLQDDKEAFKEGWKYGFFDAVILTETGGLGNAATHLNMYQQDSIEYFKHK